MNLSPQDASEALDTIESVDRRVREMVSYRAASPFLILWGVIWLVANVTSDLAPAYSGRAWSIGTVLGALLTAALVLRRMRRVAGQREFSAARRARVWRRTILLAVTVIGFFPAMFTVLAPLGPQQQGAFISLFWAFAYMAAGVWLGMRLFVTGLVTALAILFGYLFIHQHFAMWMGVVGGGSLLLAGFWLRRT